VFLTWRTPAVNIYFKTLGRWYAVQFNVSARLASSRPQRPAQFVPASGNWRTGRTSMPGGSLNPLPAGQRQGSAVPARCCRRLWVCWALGFALSALRLLLVPFANLRLGAVSFVGRFHCMEKLDKSAVGVVLFIVAEKQDFGGDV